VDNVTSADLVNIYRNKLEGVTDGIVRPEAARGTPPWMWALIFPHHDPWLCRSSGQIMLDGRRYGLFPSV
jgi:hypothetical protein